MNNKQDFIKKYQRWLDYQTIKKLQLCKENLTIGIIKKDPPNNQFVAVWDTPNDELKPFGLEVKKYARHYTPIVEWEFPFTSFIYKTNYCSIDHLGVVSEFYHRMKGKCSSIESEVNDVEFQKRYVTTHLKNNEKLTSKVYIDACGYGSIPNQKFHCNDHSPIYQMLVWKYPNVRGLNREVNNIWLKPNKLYTDLGFDANDRVAGWFHPLPDGVIIGGSKYLYSPWPWEKLRKHLRNYLEKYIEIRHLVPEGEKQEIQGIGVLYNPNHNLKKRGLLQLGDARRVSRPCTGYGFIPALWHGLFGAISTAIAFNEDSFSHLDKITMKLFNRLFLFNYSWEYCMQKLYMDGEWSNMTFIFKTVKEVLNGLPEGFLDRLTMTIFTRSDVSTSISRFFTRVLTNPQLILKLPRKTKIEFITSILKNRILALNRNYFPQS